MSKVHIGNQFQRPSRYIFNDHQCLYLHVFREQKVKEYQFGLADIVWSNPYMHKDNKLRIHKTCIRPIMTYGTEVREEINKTKHMLRVVEMKTLRTIVGKTRRDNVKHKKRQCKKHKYQRTMRNTTYCEIGKTT